ncbi:hypothetical protein SAMN04487972_12043 [Paracoccus halophilus]|uniref:Uncharacterized protein n=1 Tax=Paracoccus halophilus TaxID=376733 RepID=A0A1I0U3F8_9RHOB|nr:hypothetical protein [Paracoccus halophilus]SFA58413.1 hypothetical protein SAMN04487972_12043 [Paracoccus halophilus]
MFHNFDGLTRNDGRWLNLWAAFDVTGEYLGTFTLDDLRAKAADAGKWISAVQYRRAGQQIDQAAPVGDDPGQTDRTGTTPMHAAQPLAAPRHA